MRSESPVGRLCQGDHTILRSVSNDHDRDARMSTVEPNARDRFLKHAECGITDPAELNHRRTINRCRAHLVVHTLSREREVHADSFWGRPKRARVPSGLNDFGTRSGIDAQSGDGILFCHQGARGVRSLRSGQRWAAG